MAEGQHGRRLVLPPRGYWASDAHLAAERKAWGVRATGLSIAAIGGLTGFMCISGYMSSPDQLLPCTLAAATVLGTGLGVAVHGRNLRLRNDEARARGEHRQRLLSVAPYLGPASPSSRHTPGGVAAANVGSKPATNDGTRHLQGGLMLSGSF